MPPLSIITINRNNAVGLEKTIQSVLNQTYTDFEYIIVDGASTDGSVDSILRVESLFGPRLKWVSETDSGIYNAMNKGIRMASGEYILILNSSDLLMNNDVIKTMVNLLEEENAQRGSNPISILLGNIVRDDNTPTKKKKGKVSRAIEKNVPSYSLFTFYYGTVPHDAALIRNDVIHRYGMYDEEMKICSDWKLFMHAIALGEWHEQKDGSFIYIPPISQDSILRVNIDLVLFDTTGISERNHSFWEIERRPELERCLPKSILKDYDRYSNDIQIMTRIRRHPIIFKMVHFAERVLFKMEKWNIIRSS